MTLPACRSLAQGDATPPRKACSTVERRPRRALWAACVALVTGLAAPGCAWRSEGAREGIVEVASGRRVDRDELLQALRQADHVLLGELHDNPAHHARRGELIEALRPGAVIVEQLPAGARVKFGGDLKASLVEAGFDTKGWGWPLHQPVFAAAAGLGLPVLGGNLERAQARSVASQGEAAWPAELRPLLLGAPLPDKSRQALDADLVRGHCGHLSAERLPGMRAAQRARDASMMQAMLGSGSSRTVLVAGNGHVRLDYGVGQLLAALHPTARVVSVGFAEVGDTDLASRPYTYLWVTAKAERKDPCEGFVPAKVR